MSIPPEASELVPHLEAERRGVQGLLSQKGPQTMRERFRARVGPTLRALEMCGGSITLAASRLGLTREGLRTRLGRYEQYGWIRRLSRYRWGVVEEREEKG